MKIVESNIKGCFEFKLDLFNDNRGYFYETYNIGNYIGKIEYFKLLQSNLSVSKYGTLRGLHFQKGNAAQAKLLTCIKGTILDVVVDCRKNSSTFGNIEKFILFDSQNQVFVPRGCAHGFLVLSEEAIVQYHCDNIYQKNKESGIKWNDKELNIDWSIDKKDIIVSDKDKNLPTWKDSYKFD